MPNITLSISEETKRKLEEHPSIKWSNVVRSVIERKLWEFEEAERLAKKSRLQASDFEPVSEKIAVAARKQARKLLNESNR
jgi:hypothetical protein